MQTTKLCVRFSTPAFLGNAEQNGQWRTPPFKAQLRQWWRVAYAASKGFKPDLVCMRDDMRDEEGRLFGHAWLENDRDDRGNKVASRKSLVRIRLGQWSEGDLKKEKWQALARVNHPEAPSASADLYMGYGPIVLPRGERSPTLKASAAIQAGEHTSLSIAYPEKHVELIEQALYLMDRFGTVGGRSRNGWGSYSLTDDGGLSGGLPLRDWKECLQFDWAHAIGSDAEGALIWQTRPCSDWKALMKELAVIKIGLRTRFIFKSGKNAASPEERHWLSYPVTHHSVAAWGGNARLPNSLRFKVSPAPDGQLIGVIFHMPCLPPPAFLPDRSAIETVWEKVHDFLNASAQTLTRIKA